MSVRFVFGMSYLLQKLPTFLIYLKVMFPVCLDYSKHLVLFRYVFNLCLRYVLKNDISKTY